MFSSRCPSKDHDGHSSVRVRLVPHISHGSPCHAFDVVEKEMTPGAVLKLGRYTSKQRQRPWFVSFKSKVVSRNHAELWCDGSKIYLRDAGSSSGTFINRLRLSAPRNPSRSPQLVQNGDVVQLGVDFQNGTEAAYRAVRMRVEIIPRSAGVQHHHVANAFSKTTAEQLQNLRLSAASEQECCICLCPIAPAQALFVAPCAHIYHFKCMRPLIEQHFPAFSCPMCRGYSDLDASVDTDCPAPRPASDAFSDCSSDKQLASDSISMRDSGSEIVSPQERARPTTILLSANSRKTAALFKQLLHRRSCALRTITA